MVKFLKKTILFSLPLMLLGLALIFSYGISIPNLSNSISFNAKLLFMEENKIENELDVLVIGSSMSLNNVHSQTMVNRYGPKYLNLSSWGQTIEQDFELIQKFVPRYKPKTLVISSNFMDFENNPITIKYDLLDEYVFENGLFSGFDLRYNIKNSKDFQKYKQDVNGYEYLNYDQFGGINLKGENLIIDKVRWEGRNIADSQLDQKHYSYLDSISNYCKVNHIDFVFVQGPFREGYSSKLNSDKKAILVKHTAKVNSILKKYDHQFVNTLNSNWPDSLFADYSHLNEKGAKQYTELFLEKIK